MRSSAEGVDCANVSLHDQDPIGGLADTPTPLPTAWTMMWRRWRGFREWHREPLRASLWRQKVDVVKGREPKDFGHVGQSVQRLEQILELSGRRDPEERPGRLVGLVEIAVRNPAWHAYQITSLGDAPHPIKLQRQLPFLHENKLVLDR